MPLSTTRFAWLLAMLFGLAGLGGCDGGSSPTGGGRTGGSAGTGGTTPAGGGTKVTLALNWVPEPEFGGFYAALKDGAYRRNGLDVAILPGGAGAPVAPMVASGRVEFGVVSANEIIAGRPQGQDLVAVFAVHQTSPRIIMAHHERGYSDLGQLLGSEGKLLAEPGSAFMKFLVKKHGEPRVQVVPYTGSLAPFLQDPHAATQGFAFSEPISARQQGADPRVFLVADEGFNPYEEVVAVRDETLKEKRSIVEAFVRATREGWESYLKDPGSANGEMGKLNESMSAETFAEAAKAQAPLLSNDDTRRAGLGAMTRERWETLGKQLADVGVVERVPAAEECFVNLAPASETKPGLDSAPAVGRGAPAGPATRPAE